MKLIRTLIIFTALMLFAGQAAAQSTEEAEREAAAIAAEKEKKAAAAEKAAVMREQEVARRLEEAERRMAEAARTIAELSSERLPQMREIERRFELAADDRPRLGVNIGDEFASGPVEGVNIVAVTPGSAADDAGLRAGDMITAINGESMSADSSGEASRLILDFMDGVVEGDVLDVEYLRDGKVGTVEVEPRPVPASSYAFRIPRDFSIPSAPVAPDVVDELRNRFVYVWPGNVWADMELVELSDGLGKYFGADTGVLVVSAPESDALQLEDGDVILSIDAREPSSVRHALRILGSYQAGETLSLEIMRDKRKRTLEIEIPDGRSGMLLHPSPAPRPAVAPRPAPAPKPAVEKT